MSKIKKVAVIGAGLMGSGIAAHVANAGINVLLLDIVPENADNRNILVENALKNIKSSKPASLMHPSLTRHISIGNLEDDIDKISECDWICEAVIENLKIKKDIYILIEKHRKVGSIVSSNTSTIPLSKLVAGLPENFLSDFAITHFFNPPRYMQLLEIVQGKSTKEKVIEILTSFGDLILGKQVVICKDTPGFIANRIGIFWSMVATQEAFNLGLTVEEADAIVGKPMGIPKTGIFGLMDLTGLDLKDHVFDSMANSLPKNDAFFKQYEPKHGLNKLLDEMISNGFIGRKGKGGFYRLVKNEGGKHKEVVDLKTGKYRPVKKPQLDSIRNSKNGLRALVESKDQGGMYAWKVLANVLKYAADLIPEISDDIVSIDSAMKSGYAWKYGPFELIDQLGTDWFEKALQKEEMGIPEIIKNAEGKKLYSEDSRNKSFLTFSGNYDQISISKDSYTLADIKRGNKPILYNKSASIWDLGDEIACLEFHSKMNAIDGETVSMIKQASRINLKGFKALVIANDSKNFSVGANVGLALFAANAAMWPLLEQTTNEGQKAITGLKYSPFPVVAAPSGMTLGGGCEVCLHSDAIQAHCELYMGLVEVGVGLVPAWGGTKEMIMRHYFNKDRPGGYMPPVIEAFQTIGLAKISKSASEARDLLFLRKDDGITMNRNRLLSDAKKKALILSQDYKPPSSEEVISLPGEAGKIALSMATNEMKKAGKISDHDLFISEILAEIICGGDTDITETVNEKKLLDLEKKSILRLLREPLTLDRIEHTLITGKPLRN